MEVSKKFRRPKGARDTATVARAFLKNALAGSGFLALLTLGTSGLFKVAAFAREAFIASHFGLSSLTDAYFGFQQLPTTLVTFMFGAFALAFSPAYAGATRNGERVAWLPGLVLYSTLIGLLLTFVTATFAPWLLSMFTNSASESSAAATLIILAFAFIPIMWPGIWAGAEIATGRNIRAMLVTGLPYLLMTVVLFVLYGLGDLNTLSLPVSYLAGFAIVGLIAVAILIARDFRSVEFGPLFRPWRLAAFRQFLAQLAASSLENAGFAANQLLLLFFVAQTGSGAVTANTCAMRVGMLGFTLVGQPLAQLVQAKLCSVNPNQRKEVFQRWLLLVGSAVLLVAFMLYISRDSLISLVYLRGKFTVASLGRVSEIMPAWVIYFVVVSLNALMARYLFAADLGRIYVRRQLFAYAGANLIRFALTGRLSTAQVIWCSVLAEGCALLLNLRSCFRREENAPVFSAVMAGVPEI